MSLKPRKKRVRARRVTGLSGAPKTPGRAADFYFQYEVENKQIIELVKSWIRTEFPKKIATSILKQPDWKFMFPHWACIIHTNDSSRMDYLRNRISQLAEEEVKVVKSPNKNTTQKDNKTDPVKEWIGELEEVVDRQDDKFDFHQFARIKNMNKAQTEKITQYYKRVYEELLEAKKGKNEDLKEAWGYLKRKGLTNRIAFFERLLTELDKYINNRKVIRRPRKPKVKSAAQLVKNIQYLKESNELKVVSVNPETIVDMKQLWVYNVKYKKLICYNSLEGGFKMKGTTLQNFDMETSMCKKLRKPQEQLDELLKSGKVKLRTFMDKLTTKPSTFTGRINKDTLLVRVL